jgi:hypothetical protein
MTVSNAPRADQLAAATLEKILAAAADKGNRYGRTGRLAHRSVANGLALCCDTPVEMR